MVGAIWLYRASEVASLYMQMVLLGGYMHVDGLRGYMQVDEAGYIRVDGAL